MHLNDGQLRAHLDAQLDAEGRQHLAGCPGCQARLAAIAARSRTVGGRLARLAPESEPAPEAQAALARFKRWSAGRAQETHGHTESEGIPMLQRWFNPRLRPVWAAAALILAISVSLAFPSVRAWAGEFLGLFRVQRVAVLPVDTTRLSELAGDDSLSRQVGQLLSDGATITHEPAEPRVVASAQAASQAAGFAVRLPSEAPAEPVITVQDRIAFEFVVNRERAQALLAEAGYADLQLPPSLEGAEIAVDVPAGVTLAYGGCPEVQVSEAGPAQAVPWDQRRTCILLTQIPGPSLTAPPDIDVEQLALIGLQLMGMTPEEAAAFNQTVDWTTTLVIPIPRNGHTYEQVAVDGVTGNLITRLPNEDFPAHYALVWVKGGIVYGLTGFDDPARGLALANSLP